MRSAQRKRRLENKARNKRRFSLLRVVFLPLVFLLLIAFVGFSSNDWNGEDKMAFVFRHPDGDIGLTVMDPFLGEMTTLTIPGDTEVDVASGYGKLRVKNVWQLGVNENLNGQLLARTITKNFLFPVYLWSDSDAAGLSEGDFPKLLKFVFTPSKTNIALGDRIQMAFFSMKMKNVQKTYIDLAESQYVKKQMLIDGEHGYVLTGSVSSRLTIYFADNNFGGNTGESLRVQITDKTGVFGPAQKVGEVVEVLGGKIVAIDKDPGSSDFNCQVEGKEILVVKKVSKLFGCELKKGDTDYDLEISLGTKFARSF